MLSYNADISNLNAKLVPFHVVLFCKRPDNNCTRDKMQVVQSEILLDR